MNPTALVLLLALGTFTGTAQAANFRDYDAFYVTLPDQPMFKQIPAEFQPIFLEEEPDKEPDYQLIYGRDRLDYRVNSGTFTRTNPAFKRGSQPLTWSKATHLPGDIPVEPNLLSSRISLSTTSPDFCISAGFGGLGQSGTFQRVRGVFALIENRPYFLVGMEASCAAFRLSPAGTRYFIKLRYSKTEKDTLQQEKISINQGTLQLERVLPQRLKLDGNFYRFHAEN